MSDYDEKRQAIDMWRKCVERAEGHVRQAMKHRSRSPDWVDHVDSLIEDGEQLVELLEREP